jgi:site-specific recombinase XerD
VIRDGVKPIEAWSSHNRDFFADFRRWLREGGYSVSSIKLYSIAVRLTLGLLDKPHWTIHPQIDLDRVWRHVVEHVPNPATLANYRKGLEKLAEYLFYRSGKKLPARAINWTRYVGPLPDWLANDVRTYVARCRRSWVPERQHRATIEMLCHLTLSLRWMAAHTRLNDIGDVTPALWFEYVDSRLATGIKPATLNRELNDLQELLRFLDDEGRPVCQRMQRVKVLPIGDRLPRDVPVDQLQRLLQEIEAEAAASEIGPRRMGIMDRAWVLLMLHCGLRTGEVRRLRRSDLDTSSSLSAGLPGRRVRVEKSKGLKDRVVYLSQATSKALDAYLEVRGPVTTDHVFAYRHQPLSPRYCSQRLHTYGRRCGIRVTPHQLRHSCGTLLLNAGAPILAVQAILGHKQIDTTLRYTRLYEGTVAADYYRAMADVEGRLGLHEKEGGSTPTPGQLLAMVDALHDGTLNDIQREMVHTLRNGILALVEQMTETV